VSHTPYNLSRRNMQIRKTVLATRLALASLETPKLCRRSSAHRRWRRLHVFLILQLFLLGGSSSAVIVAAALSPRRHVSMRLKAPGQPSCIFTIANPAASFEIYWSLPVWFMPSRSCGDMELQGWTPRLRAVYLHMILDTVPIWKAGKIDASRS
jgi:hypothetical protein